MFCNVCLTDHMIEESCEGWAYSECCGLPITDDGKCPACGQPYAFFGEV